MKKLVLITLIILFSFGIYHCESAESSSPQNKTQPQYGGTLRYIIGSSPKVLGYFPELPLQVMLTIAPSYVDKLVNVDKRGNLVPELATSWETNPDNKTIIWHLRKGVKFHDGTDFNAEAAKWTYQITLDAGRLPYGNLIKTIEVIDQHTLKFNLTNFNNRLVQSYGEIQFFSPTSIKENGIEWARFHPVGTGPFKVVEYKRDAYIKMERFKGYWRPGRPYLDEIVILIIPDTMSQALKIQTGEADLWMSAQDIKLSLDLEKKGFKSIRQDTSGGVFFLLPDSKNPDSILANKKVREAMEYAIDRPAITKAFGPGILIPLNQIAPSNAEGIYSPDFNGRPYNPEKAKKLLQEAGYPNGFKTTIFTRSIPLEREVAIAIQGYFSSVGIEARVDVCDPARLGTLQVKGWKDGLIIMPYGVLPNYVVTVLNCFGPLPTLVPIASLGRSTEYSALIKKLSSAYDDATERMIVQEIVRKAGEDAMLIPLLINAANFIMQDYVHPEKSAEHGDIPKFFYETWISKQ